MNTIKNQKIEDLKVYFREHNITQEQIAIEMGVSQAYINGLLTGKKSFGKKKAQEFGDKYGISPIWLLTGEGQMLNNSPNSGTIVNNAGDGNSFFDRPKGPSPCDDLIDLLKKKDEQIAKKDEQIDRLLAIIERQQK